MAPKTKEEPQPYRTVSFETTSVSVEALLEFVSELRKDYSALGIGLANLEKGLRNTLPS